MFGEELNLDPISCPICGATLDLIEYVIGGSEKTWECPDCRHEFTGSGKNDLEDVTEDEEDDDNERLSVYDAALIWASNGKDEDYMFGYSAEELEDAL